MKTIYGVEFKIGSKEELLPGFSPDFPYIASYVELDKYLGRQAPWHWHKEVELFYMEKGTLEYITPQGKILFPAGSGGFVNSNVLHMTRAQKEERKVVSLLHLFDPVLIGGHRGSIIEQKYVNPLITASHAEIIGLFPGNPEQDSILAMLRQSFQLSEEEQGYEIHLRTVLSDLWCQLLKLAGTLRSEQGIDHKINDKIKLMLIYINEHYGEKVFVEEIAAAAFVSERECFRVFRDGLHTTPVEYLKEYRMQRACHMLADSTMSITEICQSCGLGSSSYFGKSFRERVGCTPTEYRSLNQYHSVKNFVPFGPNPASQGQEEEGAAGSGFGQEEESGL